MDVQIKKGILEVCVLAALKNEESYGYKIISDISPIIEISESTLYPILKRLESLGYLTTRSAEHNGRLRKYYMITLAGKARIREFTSELDQITRVYDFICREDNKNDKI
ncbi:MAG: PadR family transcriptional regulator [Clostridiales bacterium]|nr:PadR family transcriptional regulator [Clostridiales bacterium]